MNTPCVISSWGRCSRQKSWSSWLTDCIAGYNMAIGSLWESRGASTYMIQTNKEYLETGCNHIVYCPRSTGVWMYKPLTILIARIFASTLARMKDPRKFWWNSTEQIFFSFLWLQSQKLYMPIKTTLDYEYVRRIFTFVLNSWAFGTSYQTQQTWMPAWRTFSDQKIASYRVRDLFQVRTWTLAIGNFAKLLHCY
jgi:hypothetical protein